MRAGACLAMLALVAGCATDREGMTRLRVPHGASLADVADTLAAHDVGTPRFLFKLAARLTRLDRRLQAGVYDVPLKSTIPDLITLLASGRTVKARLTVPEGLAIPDVVALAARQLGLPIDSLRSAFADSLEGYLYPDTYLVELDVTPWTLAETLRRGFDRAWRPQWEAAVAAHGLTRAQAVTLASIVEGEAVRDDERPVIAAVYLNRIRQRMPLQADPTVQYAILRATGARKPRLYNKDYATPSPYNTYLHPGLPPGPVNSPGARSLAAVAAPARVPYLYFVARGDGGHIFTTTYREHLQAIARVRRAAAQRGTQVGAPERSPAASSSRPR